MQTGRITPDPFFASLLFVEECRLIAPLSSAQRGLADSKYSAGFTKYRQEDLFQFQRFKNLTDSSAHN